MAGLALNLLGPPAVARSHGTPARGVGAAKNLALLAYLTLEPGAHTREELAALLWSDSSDTAARASLRQALKRLRAAVGDLLHVDRHAVQVRGSIECDVTQFLHALESSPASCCADWRAKRSPNRTGVRRWAGRSAGSPASLCPTRPRGW